MTALVERSVSAMPFGVCLPVGFRVRPRARGIARFPLAPGAISKQILLITDLKSARLAVVAEIWAPRTNRISCPALATDQEWTLRRHSIPERLAGFPLSLDSTRGAILPPSPRHLDIAPAALSHTSILLDNMHARLPFHLDIVGIFTTVDGDGEHDRGAVAAGQFSFLGPLPDFRRSLLLVLAEFFE